MHQDSYDWLYGALEQSTWEAQDKVNFIIPLLKKIRNAEYRAEFAHQHRINGTRNTLHIARDKAQHTN